MSDTHLANDTSFPNRVHLQGHHDGPIAQAGESVRFASEEVKGFPRCPSESTNLLHSFFVRCGVFMPLKNFGRPCRAQTLKSDCEPRLKSSMGMSSFRDLSRFLVETHGTKSTFPYICIANKGKMLCLLTMRLLSQRIRSTPNSEREYGSLHFFQHYALIGAQRVGGVGG